MALTPQELSAIRRRSPHGEVHASSLVKLFLASPNPRLKGSSALLTRFPGLGNYQWTDAGMDGGMILRTHGSDKEPIVTFEIYQLDDFHRRFKCELYKGMGFTALSNSFYSFELDECVAGLLFPNPEAAKIFMTKAKALAPKCKKKKFNALVGLFMVRKTKKRVKQPDSKPLTRPPHLQMEMFRSSATINTSNTSSPLKIQPNGTIDLDSVSDAWKIIFFQSGFSPDDLKKPELVERIVEVLEYDEISSSVKQISARYGKPPPEDLAKYGNSEFIAKFRSVKAVVQKNQEQRKKLNNLVKSFNGTRTAEVSVPPPTAPFTPLKDFDPFTDDVGYLGDLDFDVIEAGSDGTSKVEGGAQSSPSLSYPPSLKIARSPTGLDKGLTLKKKKKKLPPCLPDAADFDESRKSAVVEKLRKLKSSFNEIEF